MAITIRTHSAGEAAPRLGRRPSSKGKVIFSLGAATLLFALLPTLLKAFINLVLKKIPDVKGRIRDLELSILRGVISIKGLEVVRISAQQSDELLYVDKLTASVRWRDLLKGKLV